MHPSFGFPRPLKRLWIFSTVCFILVVCNHYAIIQLPSSLSDLIQSKITVLNDNPQIELLTSESSGGERQLVLLHMLFRHGLRAPFMLYPSDPNNASFWKEGLSMATKVGRLQNFMMGSHLRKRYKNFITTNPKEVELIAATTTRTHYSAYAFIAGLYEPTEENRFTDDIPWQPIIPKKADHEGKKVLTRLFCQVSTDELEAFQNSKLVNDTKAKYKSLFEFLSFYSGWKIDHFFKASDLGKTLRAEQKYNLTVPKWAYTYWEELKYQTGLAYYFQYGTKLIQRLRIGPLFKFMVEKIHEKINNTLPEKRVFVYSAHGSSMAQVLMVMNQFNFIEPHQASAIVLELWKESKGNYSIRWLHFNSTSPELKIDPPFPLYFEECGGEFCPLETFIDMIKFVIPEDWAEECYGNTTVKLFQPCERVIEFPPVFVSSSRTLFVSSTLLVLIFVLAFMNVIHLIK